MNRVPLLVEQDGLEGPTPGLDVEVVPWRGSWQPACRVSTRYRDVFTVTESFGMDQALRRSSAPLAVQLATALARTRGGSGLSLAAAAPASVAGHYPALAQVAKRYAARNTEGTDTLPAFGGKAKTQFPDFSDTVTTAVVVVDGQPFVARVGLGGVGWRPIGDYLVVLYRQGAKDLEPAASFVVSQHETGLLSSTAEVPKPWVNQR